MDYEKKYKEALAIARWKIDTDCGDYFTVDDIKDIFSELKESEDERIRKMLIRIYKKADMGGEIFGEGITYKQVIAWLEKQGEQNTEVKYVYPKFRVGDAIVPIKPNGHYVPERVQSISKGYYYCKSDDNKAFSSIPIRSEDEYKLYEQKSAWSEEDEQMIQDIIEAIDTQYSVSDYKEMVNWLKSLKPNHWKPSEKQMEAPNDMYETKTE